MLLQTTLAMFRVALAVGLPLFASEAGEYDTFDPRDMTSGEDASVIVGREAGPIVKRGHHDGSDMYHETEYQPSEGHAESTTYVWNDPRYKPIWDSLTPDEDTLWRTCVNEKASDIENPSRIHQLTDAEV